MMSMVFIFLTVVFTAGVNADVNSISEKSLKNSENILKAILQLSSRHHDETRVAFSAAKSQHLISTRSKTNDIVIFDKIITNIGNAYNKTTGKFTAPCDGLFVFHWTILTYPGKVFDTELVVNGVPKRRNAANANEGSSYNSGSSMVTLELNEYDEVWIRKWTNYGDKLYGNYWPGFSGFKLA